MLCETRLHSRPPFGNKDNGPELAPDIDGVDVRLSNPHPGHVVRNALAVRASGAIIPPKAGSEKYLAALRKELPGFDVEFYGTDLRIFGQINLADGVKVGELKKLKLIAAKAAAVVC